MDKHYLAELNNSFGLSLEIFDTSLE